MERKPKDLSPPRCEWRVWISPDGKTGAINPLEDFHPRCIHGGEVGQLCHPRDEVYDCPSLHPRPLPVKRRWMERLTRRIKEEARQYGGADNPKDYLHLPDPRYCDKPHHALRSMHHQPNHGKHWGKQQPKT